jgi:hypothetical protein
VYPTPASAPPPTKSSISTVKMELATSIFGGKEETVEVQDTEEV